MKVITILVAAGLVFAASGQSTSSDDKKTQTKKATKAADPPKIPPEATPLPDGSFRYVDKDGRKWIYRNTPFGVSKGEERAAPPAPKIEDDPTRSEDLGDSVRFTRPTPFGPKVWTTKKSDLSDFEKTIFERDNKKSTDSAKHDGTAGQSDGSKQSAAKQAK